MKRFLLISVLFFAVTALQAQIEEDFTPLPAGWVLSQGAGFNTLNGNNIVVTPGVGGNNPARVGTPPVNKTSNTVEVCLEVTAYNSNLNAQQPFPCNTYMDVLFVKSTVTDAKDADKPQNLYARVDNHLLPTAGGKTCFQFTFPPGVTDPDFKVFLNFHADCNQGGIKYVMDNISISGVDDVCAGGCPPTALNDAFVRANVNETSFTAALFGSNLNFPAPPAGYTVDATGTDGDPNDTYTHLQWSVITQPVNGNVVINADGTCTITRNSLQVSQLTFTYNLCDDGNDNNFATTADNLCDDATVTVNFPTSAPLPVSIINFSSARNGANVVLKWTTTFENNNKGFEIQRSIGGGDFKTVGSVSSKGVDGNSQVSLNYEFTEMNSTTAFSFYRLVQSDKDGNYKVFVARPVHGLEQENKMIIFPNPSQNGNISVSFGTNAEREVVISDMGGKIVKRWNSYKNENLAITGLNSGMYMITVTDKETNKRTVEKIVITKQ
jgi:hypothetical protein